MVQITRILFIIFLLSSTSWLLSAHQGHFEKNTKGILQTEIVTQSNKSTDNESICIPDVLYNVNMCCCSDALCIGSGNECYCNSGNNPHEMSCKSHCEDVSNDINLANQDTKVKNLHNLFSKINYLSNKITTCNKFSQKVIFLNTPTYISLQSILI